jgi:hypothetical protein
LEKVKLANKFRKFAFIALKPRIFFEGLALKYYHQKHLLIIWSLMSFILSNYFVNDFQALLVSNDELNIKAFKELIEIEDISILVQKGSYCEKIFKNVNFKSF